MPNDAHAVLCGVDFSSLSSHVLEYGQLLAQSRHAPLLALHTMWWEAPAYFTPARVEKLQREYRDAQGEAERSLRQLVDASLGAGAAGVEIRVREGMPAGGILQTAAEIGAGLIVMGTHGRSGWNRFTLGSVAELVLGESSVPVLTLRQGVNRPLRRILCPVSDTAESRQALAVASEYAVSLSAGLTALHVREPDGAAAIPDLCAWIPAEQRSKCSIREVVLQGHAAEQIIQLAAAESYDLLVIGAPRRRYFEGMVLGTTTRRTVRHAPCPVMTVSPPG